MTDINAKIDAEIEDLIPPRGFRIVQVRESTNKHGKVTKAHTRLWAKKRKPYKARAKSAYTGDGSYADDALSRPRQSYDRAVKETAGKEPGKYDPISHRRVKFTETGTPTPRFADKRIDPVAVKLRAAADAKSTYKQQYFKQAEAQRLYDQLALPLAFFYGLKFTSVAYDEREAALHRQCRSAIQEAMSFIDRFTAPGDYA